jgi:hypothetical protein
MVAIRVEQQAGPVSPVKQRFHPLHDGAHPCADRRRIHGAADRVPVELPDIDDRGGIGGVDNRRNSLGPVERFDVKLGLSHNPFRTRRVNHFEPIPLAGGSQLTPRGQ